MTTLSDIARLSGTSISTVSRALKDSPHISREVKDNIIRIAEETGYRKHLKKKTDSGRTAGHIGLILPEVQSEYYARLVHLAAQNLQKQQFSLSIRITEFNHQTLVRHITDFGSMNTDGLLIVVDDEEYLADDIYSAIREVRKPVMFITSSYISNLDFDGIYLDELRGISMGIEHLMERGYRKIGFIGEPNTLNRLTHFREAMQNFRLPINEDHIIIDTRRAEAGGYEGMKTLLSRPNPPEAVFAGYDQMALGAMKALHEAGLRIPEDMAILGFDDAVFANYVDCGITTIQNPCEDMMAISCRVLVNQLTKREMTPQQIALKPRLIIRGST